MKDAAALQSHYRQLTVGLHVNRNTSADERRTSALSKTESSLDATAERTGSRKSRLNERWTVLPFELKVRILQFYSHVDLVYHHSQGYWRYWTVEPLVKELIADSRIWGPALKRHLENWPTSVLFIYDRPDSDFLSVQLINISTNYWLINNNILSNLTTLDLDCCVAYEVKDNPVPFLLYSCSDLECIIIRQGPARIDRVFATRFIFEFNDTTTENFWEHDNLRFTRQGTEDCHTWLVQSVLSAESIKPTRGTTGRVDAGIIIEGFLEITYYCPDCHACHRCLQVSTMYPHDACLRIQDLVMWQPGGQNWSLAPMTTQARHFSSTGKKLCDCAHLKGFKKLQLGDFDQKDVGNADIDAEEP